MYCLIPEEREIQIKLSFSHRDEVALKVDRSRPVATPPCKRQFRRSSV